MKLKEILVIGINPDYKDTLLAMLPLDGQRILDVDVYQMEIDSELKILFYDLDLDHKIPVELIDHIKPHLSSVLLIGDSSFSVKSVPKQDFVNNLIQELNDVQVIMAVGLTESREDDISKEIKKLGFYLAKNSRMFFWRPDDEISIKNIWRSLLVDLNMKNNLVEQASAPSK